MVSNANTSSGIRGTSFSSWCRPHREPAGRDCCFRPKTPIERPDPAIYSQEEALSNGLSPTWNSPDITTNWYTPWKMMPEFPVTVRNLSAVATAVDAQITLFTAPYGLGMPRTPLATRITNLPPLGQTTLNFAVPPALLAGDQRIATYVEITHPSDKILINNRGAQQIAGIHTAQDGRNASVALPVMNNSGSPRQITLSVLGNALGASVTPATHVFVPWEQISATFTIHVPASMHNTVQEVTVVAWSGVALVDGITFHVEVND